MEIRLSKRIVAVFTCVILFIGVLIGTQTVYAASKPAKVSIKSVQASTNKVNIAWKKVSKNCTGYQVYRSKKSKGEFVEIATLNSKSKTSYVDKTIEPCTKYYYKVRAYNNYEMEVTQYYNSKTGQWADEQPIPEEWFGEETRVVPVEKYVYGSFSKIKNVKTKTAKIQNKRYTCYKVGDVVFCASLYELARYDIKTDKRVFLNVPCDAGFIVHNGYIYSSAHSDGFSDDMTIWRTNIITSKTQRLVSDSLGHGFAIKGDVIYYKTYTNLTDKNIYNGKLKTAIKTYNINTGKRGTTKKYQVSYLYPYPPTTNDNDYTVSSDMLDGSFLYTPDKTISLNNF